MGSFFQIVQRRRATFESISRGIEDVRLILSAKGLEKGDQEIEETVIRLTKFIEDLEKGAARIKAIAQISPTRKSNAFFANLAKETTAMKKFFSRSKKRKRQKNTVGEIISKF